MWGIFTENSRLSTILKKKDYVYRNTDNKKGGMGKGIKKDNAIPINENTKMSRRVRWNKWNVSKSIPNCEFTLKTWYVWKGTFGTWYLFGFING